MAYISRDPFAREELHRKTVNPGNNTCDWCGNLNRHDKLFQYYVEPDRINYQKNDIDGLFCSIGCMRSYHDN